MLPDLAVDFETPYSKEFSVVDLGYWKYARDARCLPYMISVCDGTETWAGHPDDFNFDSLNGRVLVSANAAFDEEIAQAAIERGIFPKFTPADWHCSSNMTSYLHNVRSLADGAKAVLGIDVDKGVRDRAKGKSWEDIKAEGWAEDMLRYARLDAQYCKQIWDKASHLWPEHERRLSRLTIDQGRYGLRIDVARLDEYIEKLNRVIFVARTNLPWIARGRAPASPIGMAEECRAAGIPCPPVKAHDPEAAAEWEDKYAPLFPWVMAVRNMRKAKKTLATLETIKLRLRPDETVAFSLKYGGTHTLRWAGDSGWNLQNMNKEPLFISEAFAFELHEPTLKLLNAEFDENTKKEKTWSNTKYSPVDIRGLVIAREGHKLAPTDLAQIEPRALNWLAGNHSLLARIAGGMSIYEAFARDSMGWTGGDLKTEDKKKYNLSKIQVLSLGYGAGWKKFIAMAAAKPYEMDITVDDEKYAIAAAFDGKIYQRTKIGKEWFYIAPPIGFTKNIWEDADGIPPSVEKVIFVQKERRNGEKYLSVQTVYGQQSRALVKDFRESNPLIVNLWNLMEEQLRDAVGGDLVIELPSGRSMRYRNVRREIRKFEDPDDEDKKIEKVCFTAEIGGKRYVLYGGLIVENITQAISRDVFAHNLLLTIDAGVRCLFTVHDEDVPEVPKDFDSSVITRIMSTTPAWMPGLPVGAETKDTQRYLK